MATSLTSTGPERQRPDRHPFSRPRRQQPLALRARHAHVAATSRMRAVLMHFRGCSGEPNRLARAYHSGDTGDIDFLVRTLKAREPNTPLAAIGYSLGGNALLKWLGEQARMRRCNVLSRCPCRSCCTKPPPA